MKKAGTINLETNLLDFKQKDLRPGQTEALKTIMDKINSGQRYISIVLPTRYGKSDVIRVSAFQLKKHNRAFTSFALNPNTFLKHQIVNLEDCDKTKERYEINKETIISDPTYPSVSAFGKEGEDIISLTMQWITQPKNAANMKEWTEHIVHKHGLPPVFFVDECHTGSESNKWGNTIKNLVDAGAICIQTTATAYRSDNDRIAGFNYEPVKVSEGMLKRHAGDINEFSHLVDIIMYQDQTLRLVPDYEMTFKQAWGERPSVLCKLNRKTFGINLENFMDGRGSGDTSTLFELNPTAIRKTIGRAIRDKVAIREGCNRFVQEFKSQRQILPNSLGIIYCANDIDANKNGQLKHIKQRIEKIDKTLRVLVLTSTNKDEDISEKTALQLESFIKGDEYDILAVKQMAGLGLNAPRIKTGLDLSPTRTMAAYVQRLMRIATPYKGVDVATWICPEEKITEMLWHDFVENQGGDIVERAEELIKRIIEDRKKPPPPSTEDDWRVIGCHNGRIGDSTGIICNSESWGKIDPIVKMFPLLTKEYTQASIIKGFERLGLTLNVDNTRNIDKEKQDLIDAITEAQATTTGHRLRRLGFGMSMYEKTVKQVFVENCQKAGVPIKKKSDSKTNRVMDAYSKTELQLLNSAAERTRHEEESRAKTTKLYTRPRNYASVGV